MVNSVYQESWYEYAVETEFSLENKLITSVDLVITPPEVGRPFNSKNIQVSAGAHCYIEYKEWNEYTDDENGYWSNVFDKETMYISYLVLTPEAGSQLLLQYIFFLNQTHILATIVLCSLSFFLFVL